MRALKKSSRNLNIMDEKTEMTGQDAQFRKMTETPVQKLIITLGIPTTISMLITNIYNMADSYFVSQTSLSAGGATTQSAVLVQKTPSWTW